MKGPGHPTRYKPEYDALAHNYCLLGATNEELGSFFGVTSRTIDNWIAKIPGFASAVRAGRVVADAEVARCLYARAIGYQHTVERMLLYRGEVRTITNTVRYSPNTQACIFWLRHRRPQTWGDSAKVSADGPVDLLAPPDAAGEKARRACGE